LVALLVYILSGVLAAGGTTEGLTGNSPVVEFYYRLQNPLIRQTTPSAKRSL
jgi:hypothetical protein